MSSPWTPARSTPTSDRCGPSSATPPASSRRSAALATRQKPDAPLVRGRSLWGRLASALGLTAALSVAGTALITFGLVRQYAEQQALTQLQRQAAAAAAHPPPPRPRGGAPPAGGAPAPPPPPPAPPAPGAPPPPPRRGL